VTLLLTFILVIQTVPAAARAAETSGKTASIKWSYSSGTLTISPVSGAKNTEEWRVFESRWDWRGYFPWRDYSKKIVKVVIKKGVKSIPSEAFREYGSLKEVKMADTVETIGSNAFNGCGKLNSIDFSQSLTRIERGAFSGCKSLKKVVIPDSAETIGDGAFSSCVSLKSAALPKYMTVINRELFSGCAALTDVKMPQKLETIEYNAFSGCSSLNKLQLPAGLKTLNASFRDCVNLKRVTIPESLETANFFYVFDSSVTKLYFNGESGRVFYFGETADSVRLDQTHVILKKKEEFTLNAVRKADKISWESLNPEVAEVSSDGSVKAKKSGTAQIRAYVDNNYFALCRVDVIAPTTAINVKNIPEYISVGEIYELDVRVSPSDSTDKLEYSISNAPRADITESGEVRGLSKGSFTLTVKSGAKSKKYKIKVENPVISSGETVVTAGHYKTLKLKNTKRAVTWSSTNPGVLRVNAKGKITGIKEGYSCVIATVGDMKYYCDVRVMSDLEKRISDLQLKYPDGYYFTKHTPSKDFPLVSEEPCVHSRDGTAYCRGQCAGYANLISNEVFGANAPRYKIADKSRVKSGDYVRYGNHSVFVIYVVKKGDITGYDRTNEKHIKADDTYWYITHCNWNRDCGIIWYMKFEPRDITGDSYSRY
jgi:uncharacterized protein YjdB